MIFRPLWYIAAKIEFFWYFPITYLPDDSFTSMKALTRG